MLRRGLPIAASLVIAIYAAGCGADEAPSEDVRVSWQIRPEPARAGSTTVTVALRDSSGAPIQNAGVEIEATMTHPGMRPEMSAAEEIEPGLYESNLNLTMGGDWMLILNAELPDGRTLQRQNELRGVQTP